MNALTAPIQHVQPSEILFVIPLVPLAAAAVNGLFGDRIVASRGVRATNAIALISSLGALAAIASVLWTLYGLAADQRFLFAHLWSFAQIGSLSASVDLGADPLGASLACLVLVLAGIAHLDLIAREAMPSWHARVSLLAGGLVFAVLGDGFVPLLLGLAMSTVATALLAAHARARSILVSGHLADAAVLAGAVVLFWGLGGGWGIALGNEPTFTRHNPTPARGQSHDVDIDETAFGPSVLPVAIAGTASAAPVASQKMPGLRQDAGAKGKISLAGLAGAKIFLRGSNVPAATAPVIGIESYAGRLDIEVERPGVPRATLRAVDVPANGEIVLVPVGPTLSFREIYDQLALTDVTHKRFVRDLLDPAVPTHRRLFGVSVVGIAAALLALAAIVRGALIPFLASGPIELDSDPRTRALLLALSPIPAVFLIARLAPVFALAGGASMLLLVLAALSAVAAAAMAASRKEPMKVIGAAIAAQGSLAIAGAAAGGYGAAMLHVVIVALAGMALILAHDLPGAVDKNSPRARASFLATLALAGSPIPAFGVAWSREALLQRIFAAELPAQLGHIGWVLGVISIALVAHALVRVQLASFPSAETASSEELGSELRNALFGLVVVAAVLSIVLVVSQASIGVGPERPLYESWLAMDVGRIVGVGLPRSIDVGRGVEFGIAGVTVALAILAGRVARNGRTLGEGFEGLARTPAALLGGFVEGLGAVGRFIDFMLDLPLEIVSRITERRRR
ncbi:MAG: hypothetical protein ACXWUG_03325 [Polyangiales bacterium]